MESLLEEYRDTLKNVRKERKSAPKEESATWAGMVTSLSYVIEWLETGWQPGIRRTGQVGFRDPDAFEKVGSVDYLNPFAPNAYEEVERRIDEERMRANLG